MELLFKLGSFIQPFKGRLLLAIGLTGGMTLLGMVPPLLMKYVIDEIVGMGQWHMAPAILFSMLLVNLLSAGGGFLNYVVIYVVGQHLVFDVRRALFKHIQGLSLRFYEEMGTCKIMSRIMGDVSRIQNMVTWNTISIVNDIISFGFGIVVIFYFSWKLSLITVALLPFYLLKSILSV